MAEVGEGSGVGEAAGGGLAVGGPEAGEAWSAGPCVAATVIVAIGKAVGVRGTGVGAAVGVAGTLVRGISVGNENGAGVGATGANGEAQPALTTIRTATPTAPEKIRFIAHPLR